MEEKLPLLCWHRIPNMNQNDAEYYISDRMSKYYNGAWIIYLRYKYANEKEWTYSLESAGPDSSGAYGISWFNDWWEGQEDVEYIAMTEMTS